MNNKSTSIIVVLAMTLVLAMNSVVLYTVIEGNKERQSASLKATKERQETLCVLLIPQNERYTESGQPSQKVKDCKAS